MYQDKSLKCRDCGKDFVFTSSEQEFYAQKGFQNEPVRCPECRKEKKANFRNGNRPPRQMYDVTCSACGQPAQVPFKPTSDRPVYCRDCFSSRAHE
jgi:CxxC-x17-CxxC domain-containing protein